MQAGSVLFATSLMGPFIEHSWYEPENDLLQNFSKELLPLLV
jgi:hypothetical protein